MAERTHPIVATDTTQMTSTPSPDEDTCVPFVEMGSLLFEHRTSCTRICGGPTRILEGNRFTYASHAPLSLVAVYRSCVTKERGKVYVGDILVYRVSQSFIHSLGERGGYPHKPSSAIHPLYTIPMKLKGDIACGFGTNFNPRKLCPHVLCSMAFATVNGVTFLLWTSYVSPYISVFHAESGEYAGSIPSWLFMGVSSGMAAHGNTLAVDSRELQRVDCSCNEANADLRLRAKKATRVEEEVGSRFADFLPGDVFVFDLHVDGVGPSSVNLEREELYLDTPFARARPFSVTLVRVITHDFYCRDAHLDTIKYPCNLAFSGNGRQLMHSQDSWSLTLNGYNAADDHHLGVVSREEARRHEFMYALEMVHVNGVWIARTVDRAKFKLAHSKDLGLPYYRFSGGRLVGCGNTLFEFLGTKARVFVPTNDRLMQTMSGCRVAWMCSVYMGCVLRSCK